MHVVKNNVQILGSCNFCDDSHLTLGDTLSFPYDEVLAVTGTMSVRFCKKCSEKFVKEVYDKFEKLEVENVNHVNKDETSIVLSQQEMLALLGLLSLLKENKTLDSLTSKIQEQLKLQFKE